MRAWRFKSPLHVFLPRKTKEDVKWILNQNKYRNTHYQVLNQAKKIYAEDVANQLAKLPEMEMVHLTLTVFPSTKRLCDLDNIASVHLKFFLDALTEAGKLPDDNYQHVPYYAVRIGSIDKDNPRVEILIEEIINGRT